MKPTLVTLLLVALTATACAPQVDIATEEAAVRAVSESWLAFDREGDAAGVAGLFAADGTLHWQERRPASGPEEVQAFMEETYAFDAPGEGQFGPDRFHVAGSGDLAVEHGSWQVGGEEGRYMTVYAKVDGAWKVAADMSLATTADGGAPDWAVEQLSQWYAAFNARDAERLANLYTADARVGEARGRRAIIARFRNSWAQGERTCSGGFDGFEVVGTVATGWGRDTCTVTPADGGPTTTEYSRWLAVYERQADGTWLCIRDNGQTVGA